MHPTIREELRQAIVGILDSCRAEVMERTLGELRDQGNRIVLDQDSRQSFLEHLSTCLDGVLADLREDLPPRAEGRTADSHPLSHDIGLARAERGTHPEESIAAGLVFFRVAAATFLTTMAHQAPDIAAEAAPAVISALHRNVIERVVAATVRYMDYLLERIRSADVEERHRISREVHDRVSSEIASAYRRLELGAYSGEMFSPEVHEAVKTARSSLDEALSAIQEISTRLQVVIPHRSLHAALTEQLANIDQSGPRARVLLLGDEHLVPPRIRGEVFLILQEAIRNTLTHAHADSLDVRIDISPRQVACTVVDDGIGFTLPAPQGEPGHLGLMSMRERTEGLGGVFAATSAPGEGTEITAQIPLSALPASVRDCNGSTACRISPGHTLVT